MFRKGSVLPGDARSWTADKRTCSNIVAAAHNDKGEPGQTGQERRAFDVFFDPRNERLPPLFHTE
jgi:hypothetical protein